MRFEEAGRHLCAKIPHWSPTASAALAEARRAVHVELNAINVILSDDVSREKFFPTAKNMLSFGHDSLPPVYIKLLSTEYVC